MPPGMDASVRRAEIAKMFGGMNAMVKIKDMKLQVRDARPTNAAVQPSRTATAIGNCSVRHATWRERRVRKVTDTPSLASMSTNASMLNIAIRPRMSALTRG